MNIVKTIPSEWDKMINPGRYLSVKRGNFSTQHNQMVKTKYIRLAKEILDFIGGFWPSWMQLQSFDVPS